jgi:hypothetical protein
MIYDHRPNEIVFFLDNLCTAIEDGGAAGAGPLADLPELLDYCEIEDGELRLICVVLYLEVMKQKPVYTAAEARGGDLLQLAAVLDIIEKHHTETNG